MGDAAKYQDSSYAIYQPRCAPPRHEKRGPGPLRRPPEGASRPGAAHRPAAPCPPTGCTRSTLGARGLSFRVRNGTGRVPPAMAAGRWAAPAGCFPGRVPACPGGRTALEGSRTRGRDGMDRACACGAARDAALRARAISTARLRTSPSLHLRPVHRVVYPGPYRKGN